MNVEEEIIKLRERLDNVEQLVLADIKRIARAEAKRVVDEELAELRSEL